MNLMWLSLGGTVPANACCSGVLLTVTLLLPKCLCSENIEEDTRSQLERLQSVAERLLCARPYILKYRLLIISFSVFIHLANI